MYEVLHYAGDVTAAQHAQPGQLLGTDEMGMPWEVIDAEYDAALDRTTVQLQSASPETMRDAIANAQRAIQEQAGPLGRFMARFTRMP